MTAARRRGTGAPWRALARGAGLLLLAAVVGCGSEPDLRVAPGAQVAASGGTEPVDSAGLPASAPDAHADEASSAPGDAGEPAATVVQAPPPETRYPEHPPRFERPGRVRGIYLNAWAAGSRRKMASLLEMVEGTEVNTFVVDLKDATGYVSHRSRVPLVTRIGADQDLRIGDLHGLLWLLRERGIYPVARIVVTKDPLLSEALPELAVQDTAGGTWVDGKGQIWLNPYDRRVWDYHVALAREAAEAGFPEIQWDYVRFPDAPASEIARTAYPGAGGVSKAEAIRSFLAYAREELAELDVQVTADVFGVTTSATRDVGIGQVWESFIDVVDVALPMVYPSHYWRGSFGIETPNAYPYEIVYEALVRAQTRTAAVEGAGTVRPWLQDFTLGKPAYEAPHVRAQIQATYDVGIEEWILWNPSSRYTTEALAPAEGWPEGAGPLIPVADTVVVAADARRVLQNRRAALAAAAAAQAASPAPGATGDPAAGSAGAGGVTPRGTPPAPHNPDTLRIRPR